ncbi:ABC transporter permease [Ketogulonicigenium vulgare]|uniref:ABC-type dipeptide/oligopeptide/nickel transport system, permease component n=1 Tax=Ketogulonicigenium vulgare (strain WSH-001) TaxID=759362 RepID=F9YBB9_KETVW|nr:ABC transporter permease [Ketogulonicigenium vulgare]ADO44148.1 putative oligopeptide permease OppC [Ketogulonicigenium vulgare Y25]AEM42671.1 ABC-type dipeptide/oligopeptide/nickel transport system, permease component [Ketogulonicigenium vulgare WSH-001]ALJ82476.1 peptide ABC transporter permease [Ketogulonicigenium vulgare]ANW35260.1 peptide ABC transporter permease [Ketogulonicigenium vulgare]AOZ53372.1 oligopeptide permease OppC [Ketogulonicigenium vulgare]
MTATTLLPTLRQNYRHLTGFKAIFGLTTLALLLIMSLFSPWLAPFDPGKQDLMAAMMPPSLSGPHLLGTDHLGRDILSRIIYGARVSLVIAGAVAIFAGAVGVALGVVAGFYGGRTDSAAQKVAEIFWSFPPLMLAIAIVAFIGQGLLIVIVALTAQRWIPYFRVTRAESMALREREFIMSARTLGASNGFIIRHHILPNVLLSIIVMTSFAMANAIIAEASLSFLGLGVPPTIPTWGGMLADSRSYISSAWWMAMFPGLAIFICVLGLNLLGDALRNQFDPKLKTK